MPNDLRVTIIEDSTTQAMRLQFMLEERGATVCCYSNAEDALRRLDAERPDLVVVDYHLPGMQGDEFCRRLRMIPGAREIPILMLTEDTTVESERTGLESGADSYVSKAADADLLMLRIHSLVRKKTSVAHDSFLPDGLAHDARVLVIDDSPTFLELLRHELENEGYRVETAASGEEALRLFRDNPAECVLVDLVMPGMDGIAVCQEMDVIRRATDNSFGIIMLTSRDTKEDMMRGLEAGADDFVVKSSDSTVLKARIRALMRRELLFAENQRISQEFRNKDAELARTMVEKKAAEERAALSAEVEAINRNLAEANKKLKDTQVQLVQAAKMASLGQLVAGIAHEINNPLAFVHANRDTVEQTIAFVEKEVGKALSEEARSRLAKAKDRLSGMRDGLNRIKDLVLKLRTFSRLDEGELKDIRISEAVDSVLTLLHHRYRDRITVRTEIMGLDTLHCAPGAFNQVLVNLVGNAIDAIQGPGEILIRSAVVGDQCAITVADSGPGVPENIRDRIFDPFFTTKPVGVGTGLGLSISYQIVQRHKGTLSVGQAPGGGAEFTMRIPLHLQEEARNG